MAGGDKSTIQTILENVRDAGVGFGRRFAPPNDARRAIATLLAELGINDPRQSVTDALASVGAAWASIADTLSGINLDFTDPAALIAGIGAKGDAIRKAIDAILKAPESALDGLGASGAAIKAVLPKRLLDYIIYEFITATHPKIGGAFLLLGVLRREFIAAANAAFINAEVRVFDLGQLISAITHPRESFLTVMRWGTNDFLDRPIVDGITLLLSTIPPVVRGPSDDVFPIAAEQKFVTVDAGVRPAARRTISIGGQTLTFVGLHKHGIGLEVSNPVAFSGNIVPLPPLPATQIFAIVPGANPATDPPAFQAIP